MTPPTGPDRTAATTTATGVPISGDSSPSSRVGDLAQKRTGETMRFWNYLTLSAACATLVPLTVFAVAQLTDDGPVRLLLIWVIALLMGSAVYASAAATNAAHRRE